MIARIQLGVEMSDKNGILPSTGIKSKRSEPGTTISRYMIIGSAEGGFRRSRTLDIGADS